MSIAELLSRHKPGHALEREFYCREDVFEGDLDLLLGRWTCVGHQSTVANPGDYLTADLGLESAIVVRGDDGVLRAMHNVCRHRGSRICVDAQGHAPRLTCPYHAWSYHLDGRLRLAREMPEGFDPAAYGLIPLPLRVVGGLILISFSADPPALDDAAAAVGAMTDHYGWAGAKVATRKAYQVSANWKLVMENYHECYHCGPAHPEFSVLHALAQPGARTLNLADSQTAMVRDYEDWQAALSDNEVARVMRSALSVDCLTGSRDGKPVAPAMAPHDGACVFAEIGFLSAFLAYADHGVIYRFIPRGVLDSDMEVIWLVRGDAEEGRDYDVEALTWLWDVTSQADKRIIERNQAGVRSRAYVPGPFSKMEPGTRQYVDRYLTELARKRPAHDL